jgi:hypothetical protein
MKAGKAAWSSIAIVALALLIMPSASKAEVISPSMERNCMGTVCTVSQYGGIRYVQQAGEWVKVEESTVSLKQYYTLEVIEQDPGYIVTLEDVTYGTIKFNVKTSGKADGKPVPFSVLEEKTDALTKQVTTEVKDAKTVDLKGAKEGLVEYDFKASEDMKTDSALEKVYKFGANSTLVRLTAADTEILEDAYTNTYSTNDNTNYGTAATLNTQYGATYGNQFSYVKFNLDAAAIPVTAQIKNATMCLYKYNQYGGVAYHKSWHMYNQTWNEHTVTANTFSNNPTDAAKFNTTYMQNQTIPTDVNLYICFEATSAVAYEHNTGNPNVTVMIRGDNLASSANPEHNYVSKEDADANKHPYMNITYDEAAPPSAAAINFTLFINGTSGNYAKQYDENVNITAYANVSVPIKLYINGSLVQTQVGTLTNMTNLWFFPTGTFNLTAAWDGNATYTANSQSLFLTVSKQQFANFYLNITNSTGNFDGNASVIYGGNASYIAKTTAWLTDVWIFSNGVQLATSNNAGAGGNGIYWANETYASLLAGTRNITTVINHQNYTANRTAWLLVNKATVDAYITINGFGVGDAAANTTTVANLSSVTAVAKLYSLNHSQFFTYAKVNISVNNTAWGNATNQWSPYTKTAAISGASGTYLFRAWAANGQNITVRNGADTGTFQPYGHFVVSIVAPTFSAVTYDATTLPGESRTFAVNVTYPAGYSSTSPYFSYNGTLYTSTITNYTTVLRFEKTLTVPNITDNSFNAQLYFGIDFYGNNMTSSNYTQVIYRPFVGLCGGLSNTSTLHLSVGNETNLAAMNSTMVIALDYSTLGTSFIFNATVKNNTYDLCIYPTDQNISVSGLIQYTDADQSGTYATRDWFLDGVYLSNVTQTITLYQLAFDHGTRVQLALKDAYSNPYSSALIRVMRYYPELNQYITVTVPKVDDQGQTMATLELYDAYYRFDIYDGPIFVYSFPARLLSSTDLTLAISGGTVLDWVRYWNKIRGSAGYDIQSGYLNATYSDSSGFLKNASLVVKQTGALAVSTVCTLYNTTVPDGTMWCNLGNATGKVYQWFLTGYLTDGTLYSIGSGIINQGYDSTKLFNSCTAAANVGACREGMVITFFMVLTAALVGIWKPEASIIFMMLCVVGTSLLGLFAISIQTLVGLVFVAGIVAWRVSSKGD